MNRKDSYNEEPKGKNLFKIHDWYDKTFRKQNFEHSKILVVKLSVFMSLISAIILEFQKFQIPLLSQIIYCQFCQMSKHHICTSRLEILEPCL